MTELPSASSTSVAWAAIWIPQRRGLSFDTMCDKLRLMGRYGRLTLAFTGTSLHVFEVDVGVGT